MGCQKAIAKQIRDQQGDYLLALKGNQGTLHEDVRVFFASHLKSSGSHNNVHYTESSDKGHGRVEHRQAWVTQAIDWLKQRHPDCSGLQSIGMVESRRDRGVMSHRCNGDSISVHVRLMPLHFCVV